MYPFYNNNNTLPFLLPLYPRKRAHTLDNRGIYELCTTGIVEDTTAGSASVNYGINPCEWRALPNEFVAVWKVRHLVSTTGADLPVNLAVPTGNSSSTVTSSNSNAGTTKIPVVDNKNTNVTGKDVTNTTASANQLGYTTEHQVYVNKSAGIFRLMGVSAQTTTPAA